jgi:putative spermidine/putrescine transport system ATP-binding protein
MAEIHFQNVTKRYGGKPAVDHLELHVASGEFVSLLGPSGCGKTTSLRMLGGFIAPDEGDIRIGGVSVLGSGPETRPTAMVFQRYTLWPHMNVFHNVAFGLKLRRVDARTTNDRVLKMLELVGLPGFEKRFPNQLSGGQQQRVALARALVVEPKVLLLDEPLSSLDARLRVNLREEIRAIQRHLGITTVFVTHDQEEALAVSDRIAVMNEGLLHQVASPSELYARPATLFAAQFIGAMNLMPAQVRGGTLEAGGFRMPAPGVPDGPATLAVRPEDLEFAPDGVPARLELTTDLGHYRSLRLKTGDQTLTMFASRGTDNNLETAREDRAVRIRRALVYVGDRLQAELEGSRVALASGVV